MTISMLARAVAAALTVASAVAFAQSANDRPADAAPIKYLNGGASEEDRSRMQAQSSDFPLRIALSGHAGEYIVAERLTLSNAAGQAVASVDNAGPFVMFNLPPGRYRGDVTLPGGTHEQRSFAVGNGPQAIDWNFPSVQ